LNYDSYNIPANGSALVSVERVAQIQPVTIASKFQTVAPYAPTTTPYSRYRQHADQIQHFSKKDIRGLPSSICQTPARRSDDDHKKNEEGAKRHLNTPILGGQHGAKGTAHSLPKHDACPLVIGRNASIYGSRLRRKP
jgi:hypothetical protein